MSVTGAEIDAEQSVLGAVFLDPDVLDDITFLEERDFSQNRHQQIYKVMRYLDNKGLPIDEITVMDTFNKFGRIENAGGATYLLQLAQSVPSAANVKYYADIVRSKAMERRTKNTAGIIGEMSRDDYESDEEYFSYVEELVTALRPQDSAKMLSFSETKDEYEQHLSKRAEYIKTGFKQFDRWAHGLWREWLFISAGRPSVGKTALLLQRLYGVANQGEGAVLIFSQEMGRSHLKDRMLSSITGISYQKIKTKNLNDQERKILNSAYDGFEYLPIYMQDSSGVTIEEVRATAKRFKKKHGKLAVIAVDYLQIMKIPQVKGETRAQAIGKVTGEAKNIARELNCCFMMLSQMTRESDNGGRPKLSDLKESSSIEQDADVVEFLWVDKNDYSAEGKVITQTIAKGRDIGMNEFKLLFLGYKQKFMDLDKEDLKNK